MGTYTGDQRWDNDVVTPGDPGVGPMVSRLVANLKSGLITGEDVYQEPLELFQFAGGTDQLLADQLFKEAIAADSRTVANAVELAKTQDAIAAMLAIHQLYEAATNVAVTTADRMTTFRRMS